MGKFILTESLSSTQDLPCPVPDCGGQMTLSSAAQQVRCLKCGEVIDLTAEQTDDFAGTLAGIYDLPLRGYLLGLSIAATAPASPTGDATPAIGDVPRWLYCEAQDAYLFPDEVAA